VAFEANGQTKVHEELNYYLARFNMTGHFSGKFTELKTQLSGCALTYSDVAKMKKFGVV